MFLYLYLRYFLPIYLFFSVEFLVDTYCVGMHTVRNVEDLKTRPKRFVKTDTDFCLNLQGNFGKRKREDQIPEKSATESNYCDDAFVDSAERIWILNFRRRQIGP